MFIRLFFVVYFVATVAASSNDTALSHNEVFDNNVSTNAGHIAHTLSLIHQKGGVTENVSPGHPVAETMVIAIDGQLVNNTIPRRRSPWSRRDAQERSSHRTTQRYIVKRTSPGYEQVFAGTGTSPNDRDASIEGTAYLTYSLVSNTTYNVDDCLASCDRVTGCVFANLYYEFNNDLLDHVFSEKSNLKCALYADIHTAEEKTNKGRQQSEAPPAGLTYIQNSSGYAAKTLADPSPPFGYELVFGPTNGANNAPGYMGFAFIDRYDVNACAELCNNRDADPQGGPCQYFNIWRALVNGVPTTYTCSMYYTPADSSTAVNYGQGDLKVTYSRGYRKKTTC